jgi:hypothetical protein
MKKRFITTTRIKARRIKKVILFPVKYIFVTGFIIGMGILACITWR